MNLRNWKLGLLIATIIGFFTACGAAAVLDVVINLKFVFFFLSLIGKDVVLYLANNPASKVSFETTSVKNEAGTVTTESSKTTIETPKNK